MEDRKNTVRALQRSIVFTEAKIGSLRATLENIADRDGVMGGWTDTSGLRAEIASYRSQVARWQHRLDELKREGV